MNKYSRTNDQHLNDINKCIKTLSERDTEDPYHEYKLKQAEGILRRCAFYLEGGNTIWTEDMTDYQKVEIAIERGFGIETRQSDGIVVNYLGYHFWGFTEKEIDSLLEKNRDKKNTTKPK